MRRDVVVLGAGIVGLATALKLQETGRAVALVDRQDAGLGTSFGNAGIIERASIYPYAFPRSLGELVRYAGNATPEAYYHLSALPKLAPFLLRYWWASSPARHEKAMRAALPLIENCLSEHEPLVADAGAEALMRRKGWLKVVRSPRKLDEAVKAAHLLKPFRLNYEILDGAGVARLEPNLQEAMAGGVLYHDPVCVSDPGGLSLAYLRLFQDRGGAFLQGDAGGLAQGADGTWSVATDAGAVTARDVVVALGPWSDTVYGPLGYRLPMAVKRGYHMHYRPSGNAVLNHTMLDAEKGFLLAPMARGIRLTTGAEFAMRDAPPTPVQLARTEPHARRLFPLETRLDAKPWMGSRPCTPDMVPIVGPAPRHKGLWFNFGHAHHGLTMSAVTGRLIAEMIDEKPTFTDPAPYRADRF